MKNLHQNAENSLFKAGGRKDSTQAKQATGMNASVPNGSKGKTTSSKPAVGRQWLAELVWKATKASAVSAFIALSTSNVIAAPPGTGDEIDYTASGFALPRGAVLPAGYGAPLAGGPTPELAQYGPMGPPPGMMPSAQPIATTLPSAPLTYPGQTTYGPAMGQGYGIAPVGYHQNGMMGSPCDGMPMGYAGCCETGSCDGSCSTGGGCHFEGILPALMGGCGASSCDPCAQCGGYGGGPGGNCPLCSGCLGEGGVIGKMCSGESCFGDSDFGQMASFVGGGLGGCLQALAPYTEGGKCAQRWYDVSLEAMFLSQNLGSTPSGFALANFGVSPNIGVANAPALTLGEGRDTDLAFGSRASIAMIFGAGGNIEGTYMGGHDWGNSATVNTPDVTTTPLTSFLAGYQFRENAKLTQSIAQDANFHSGELNYRRRTVGPNCKFQGSWLMGLRYLRYDSDLTYSTRGDLGLLTSVNTSFGSDNNFFGPQAGFDFWYNVAPGFQFGTELKVAVGQNDWDRSGTSVVDNGALRQFTDGGRDTSVLGDLAVTALYRFHYSWTFRSSYHLMGISDIVAPTLDPGFIATATPASLPINDASLTLNGFTLGLEYLW